MAYEVKLSQFEGPLDLLLHLISKAKISLEDIFISEVTDQYLKYMEQIDEVDMDKMSDFLNMASTLLYIKSRSLLPNKNVFAEDDEDIEKQLIERLRAYKAFKDVCEELRTLEENAGGRYFKLPEEIPDIVAPVVWENTSVSSLYEAFLDIMKKHKENKNPYKKVEVVRDSFSVRIQSKKIENMLLSRKKFSFAEIFDKDATSMEVAVTFIALLQLWHTGKVNIEQKNVFDEIMLFAA